MFSLFQTVIIKEYPSELMVNLIGTASSNIFAVAVALIVVREPYEWLLRPDLELITIQYSAFLMVGCRNVINTWLLRKKGPVFVTMFKPLEMIIALVTGIAFLGDTLYLGSMIGAVIIAVGFYSVLWGKAKEEKAIEDNEAHHSLHSSSDKLPFLKKKSINT